MCDQNEMSIIRDAAQRIRNEVSDICQAAQKAGHGTGPAELRPILEHAELILATLLSNTSPHHTGSGCLYNGWPERNAIRLFLAQQIETDAATRLNLPLPSRGDDPTVTDQQLDQAWPELDQTLRTAMACWEYPDDLLDQLEEQARICADYVLSQASASQRRKLEHAAGEALAQQSPASQLFGSAAECRHGMTRC